LGVEPQNFEHFSEFGLETHQQRLFDCSLSCTRTFNDQTLRLDEILEL